VRDRLGGARKFKIPTIANGKVYVGSEYQVSGFGVAGGWTVAPTISPNGGVFTNSATVTISTTTPGAAIYYTLDGSTPNFSSTYYSGPFSLSHSAIVRAIGYCADFSQSEEADSINAIVLVNHKLSVLASAGGNVNLNPPGGTYISTNVVTATASPTVGSSFLYWLGDASGTNSLVNISMERDKVIQAVFGTTLSTTVVGNGQVIWEIAMRLREVDLRAPALHVRHTFSMRAPSHRHPLPPVDGSPALRVL